MVQTIPCALDANLVPPPVDQRGLLACPAQSMGAEARQALALQALVGPISITALADQAEVSRKFVYRQIDIAQQALE